MKLNGLMGTGSGKLGNSVFSVAGGEQIVRQYQPNVSNPSTTKQVDQRARMKLMSQLSADLAPVIVIPKVGLKSSRNQFMGKNFALSFAAEGTAQVILEKVQLTDGRKGLPEISAERSDIDGLQIELGSDYSKNVDRVVYNVYKKTIDNKLQLVISDIVTDPGESGTFKSQNGIVDGELVIYAYGIKDTNARATAQFGSMMCRTGVDVGKLVATREISMTDYSFTETQGATMAEDSDTVTPVVEGKAVVKVFANGGGSVSGAGTFDIGTTVTVVASPENGYVFDGWYLSGQPGKVSELGSYSFPLQSSVDLIATFRSASDAGGWG